MDVKITPKVLEWAFCYAQKDYASINAKFPQYDKWMNQTKQPTVKQLEEVARFTHVPFGFLVLDHIPPIPSFTIKDFRTIQNGELRDGEYSPELRDTIQIMRTRQDWLREYKIEQGYEKVKYIGSISYSMKEQDIVRTIHQVLDIPENWFTQIKKRNEAFTYFLQQIEKTGTVVFINGIVNNNTNRKLHVEEFRGFALVDEYAPLIFVNGADSTNARLFTLLHELIHLFLGQNGLDDGTEVFCNKIAAEVLVPSGLFLEEWNKAPGQFDDLASTFHVSELVVYRVACTLKLISKEQWTELHFSYLANTRKIKKSSGGNFNATLPYRIGRTFSRWVFNAVQEGTLLYKDAYNLLGIHGKTFMNAMKKAEVQ